MANSKRRCNWCRNYASTGSMHKVGSVFVCSDECRTAKVKDSTTSIERECEVCGRQFVPTRASGVPQKYCSPSCRVETHRRLKDNEPDPPGDPRVYTTSDGYQVHRWLVGPKIYVERMVRDENGALIRNRPSFAKRIDRAEARRRYEAGESLPTIAEALGCNTGTLSRALRQMGVAMRQPGNYAAPFDAQVVIDRYETGEGARSIAASLGISAKRVRQALVSAGVSLRPVGRVEGRGHGRDGKLSYQTEFEKMRPQVFERSGGRCEAFGFSSNCSGVGTHVHHRRRRGQGGANVLANLIGVCPFCHAEIHSHPTLATELGYLVRRGDSEWDTLGAN